jgi:hypothetical protein
LVAAPSHAAKRSNVSFAKDKEPCLRMMTMSSHITKGMGDQLRKIAAKIDGVEEL